MKSLSEISSVIRDKRPIFVSRLSLFVTLLAGILAALTPSCASSGGTSSSRSLTYTENLGAATLFDINAKSRSILDRYQFRILRVETSTDMLYIETEWKNRNPFEDEIDQGIEAGLTRIIIQARPRGRKGSSDLNTVRLQAENQVRFQVGPQWHVVPMSNMLLAYLKEITEDFVVEFRTGIRKF